MCHYLLFPLWIFSFTAPYSSSSSPFQAFLGVLQLIQSPFILYGFLPPTHLSNLCVPLILAVPPALEKRHSLCLSPSARLTPHTSPALLSGQEVTGLKAGREPQRQQDTQPPQVGVHTPDLVPPPSPASSGMLPLSPDTSTTLSCRVSWVLRCSFVPVF